MNQEFRDVDTLPEILSFLFYWFQVVRTIFGKIFGKYALRSSYVSYPLPF